MQLLNILKNKRFSFSKTKSFLLCFIFAISFFQIQAYSDSTGFEKNHDHLISCDGGAYYLYNAVVLKSDSDFTYSFNKYLNTWDEENPMIYKSANYPGSGAVKILLLPDSFSYSMPCVTNPVTSHYGWRGKRMHKGTDVDLETGDKVLAVMDGIVRYAGYYKGYGYCVLMRHLNGLETLYAHLSKLSVSSGDVIKHGTELGLGGTTGHSTGSHLHFEVHFMGRAINPELIFNFSQEKIKTHYLIIEDGKAKAFNPDSQTEEVENTTALDVDGEHGAEEEHNHPEEDAITEKLVVKKEVTAKPKTSNTAKKTHVVKKGDTLYSLARVNNTTVEQICKLNKIAVNATLNIGDKIRLK